MSLNFYLKRHRARVLHYIPSERIVPLLNAISPDDRTALLESLPDDLKNSLIKYLSLEERAVSINLETAVQDDKVTQSFEL